MVKRMINWLFLLAGAACLLYYICMGVGIRFGQSMLWVWLVAGVVLIARFAIVQISLARGVPLPYPRWFIISLRSACALGLAFFLTVEGFILSGAFQAPANGADYVIILGAKVGAKGLDHRVDAAYLYLAQNPNAVAIASGGQGADEPMPEADYIRDRLVEMGIAEERILIENKSTSTAENMKFSMALIHDRDSEIVVVTHDFHVFRSLKIARRYGAKNVTGLPVRSSAISFPHYMVREFFTTVVDTVRGNT